MEVHKIKFDLIIFYKILFGVLRETKKSFWIELITEVTLLNFINISAIAQWVRHFVGSHKYYWIHLPVDIVDQVTKRCYISYWIQWIY